MWYLPLVLAFVPVDLDGPPLSAPETVAVRLVGGRLVFTAREVIRKSVPETRTEVFLDKNGAEQVRTVTVLVEVAQEVTREELYDLARFQVLFADGRPVPLDQLAGLLQQDTPALKCARFDRSLTKNVRPDMLILVERARGPAKEK